jgi:tetratricopeptide (TPR) repeat protein
LIGKGWVPPVFFPTNLMESPPALHREGDSIIAEFYDPDVYYALSLVRNFEEMGDYERVLEEATRGLGLAQDNAQKVGFLVARAGALDELGSYDEALRDYDEALELDPQSVIAMTNRAATFLKIEEFEAAAQDLQAVLLLDPDEGVARLNLGNLHNLREEFVLAIRELTRALRSLPRGSEQGVAHLSRGNAHLELENYRESIEDFSIAAKLITDTKQKAHCEFGRAVALLELGDRDSAFRAVEASLELNDETFEAHLFKGKLSLEQGKPEDAVAEATRALELGARDSDIAQALNLRAGAYTRQDRSDLALRDYDRAIELEPSSSAIHYNRGNTLLFAGTVDAAVEAFDRAVELDGRNAGAFNNRGIAHALQGAFASAIADHTEAASIFGESEDAGSAFRHLALCYAVTGNIRSAVEFVGRARELDAGSPYNDQVEGVVCLYQGKFTDSFTLLSQVADEHGDVPDLKLYLSLPLAFLDDPDKARSLAEECLSHLHFSITKTQFTTHLSALRDMFPEQNEFAAFSRTIEPV